MSGTYGSESLIERELERIDSRHIRDLAVIGLDRVKSSGGHAGREWDDKMIEDLKSRAV